MRKKFKSVDEYISSFPEDIAERLEHIRKVIRSAAPKATEKISYNIPAFEMNGSLVYFGGFAKHIGFFPHAGPIKVFADDLKKYKTTKGTIQFPHDQKIPVTLIKKIVKYRV